MKRAALIACALMGCHKDTKPLAADAGVSDAAVVRVPAPDSPLARELGTDDAGRGTYRLFDDGPACGPAPRVDRHGSLGVGSGTMEFYATEGPAPKGPDEDARSPIQLAIKAPARVASGESFEIKTTLTNRGKIPFTYQRAMDGSTGHWVSPFVDAYAKNKANGRPSRWTFDEKVGRCGNINGRVAGDFITLKPGEKRATPFGEWANDALKVQIWNPGTYTLWVIYASCQGPTLGVSLGDDAPIPDGMFEGTIASNGVDVEVMPTL